MATNEIFRDADHLSLPVPDGTKAGMPLRIGGLNAIAETDKALTPTPDPVTGYTYNGNPVGNASVWLKGAHEFTVSFAITTVGQPVYITSANALSDVATGNSLYGHALNTKSATAGPLTVRIAN